ncbi:MAG: hypothetical protein OMM_14170, partial [Candidatus Magnetoglobus multicellularis str. Araruama]
PDVLTLTINDNDNVPTLAWGTVAYTVTESSDTLSLTARLSKASCLPITFTYNVGGTAKYLEDHNLTPQTLTIPAGDTIKEITFTLIDSDCYELSESIEITLVSTANNYSISENASSLTITIQDNDTKPSVQWKTPVQVVTENSGTITITATLDYSSCVDISFEYTVSGSATYGETCTGTADHTLTHSTFTIPARMMSNTQESTICERDCFEADENIIIQIVPSTVINATATGFLTHTITIEDKISSPKVAWKTDKQNISEGDSGTITATLTAPSCELLTISYTVSGSANSPTDHNLTSGFLSFPEGITITTVSFETYSNNNCFEGNEDIKLIITDNAM